MLWWYVPMYEYYWGLTVAQVELLSIDVPIVVFKRDKKRDKHGKLIPNKPRSVDVVKRAMEYEDKYKNTENKHSFDFGGFEIS